MIPFQTNFVLFSFFFGVYFAKKKKKINRKKVLHIFPLSASNKCLLYDFIFLSKYRSEFERMIAGNHEANSENKETTLDNSISIFLYEIFDWFFFFFGTTILASLVGLNSKSEQTQRKKNNI